MHRRFRGAFSRLLLRTFEIINLSGGKAYLINKFLQCYFYLGEVLQHLNNRIIGLEKEIKAFENIFQHTPSQAKEHSISPQK
jgi:hypothetical protein